MNMGGFDPDSGYNLVHMLRIKCDVNKEVKFLKNKLPRFREI